MIKCQKCQTANLDTSRFCDECGARLAQPAEHSDTADYVPPRVETTSSMPANVNSTDAAPPRVEPIPAGVSPIESAESAEKAAHATLVIERGGTPGTEFALTSDESTIGRWDADNGIFPDVDLDAHDEDAKVSRRHARISRNNGSYFIEDLGSTNGTYVNRGRRLLPGNIQILKDGDEVIVGKTFLRFLVNR
jgi:hypothetical protein